MTTLLWNLIESSITLTDKTIRHFIFSKSQYSFPTFTDNFPFQTNFLETKYSRKLSSLIGSFCCKIESVFKELIPKLLRVLDFFWRFCQKTDHTQKMSENSLMLFCSQGCALKLLTSKLFQKKLRSSGRTQTEAICYTQFLYKGTEMSFWFLFDRYSGVFPQKSVKVECFKDLWLQRSVSDVSNI